MSLLSQKETGVVCRVSQSIKFVCLDPCTDSLRTYDKSETQKSTVSCHMMEFHGRWVRKGGNCKAAKSLFILKVSLTGCR